MLAIALIAAFTLPLGAKAATFEFFNDLVAGQDYSFAQALMPGELVTWKFTALDDFSIGSFAIAGTGSSRGSDLANLRFGFSQPETEAFSSIVTASTGTSATGSGFLMGNTYAAGDMFSIFLSDGLEKSIGTTVSFETVEIMTPPVPAIPLPAAGLLLGTVLLGGGAFAARRKSEA